MYIMMAQLLVVVPEVLSVRICNFKKIQCIFSNGQSLDFGILDNVVMMSEGYT